MSKVPGLGQVSNSGTFSIFDEIPANFAEPKLLEVQRCILTIVCLWQGQAAGCNAAVDIAEFLGKKDCK